MPRQLQGRGPRPFRMNDANYRLHVRCKTLELRASGLLDKGSYRDVETGSDKALRARVRIPPRGVMEYCALSELHLSIGVFKFGELAGDCAGPKVFSCRYCCVICNWNQRKASDCINFFSLMVVLPNWQLTQGTTASVMSVILS